MLQQSPPEISLKHVEFLVIDESDKLFEAGVRGFRDQVTMTGIFTLGESCALQLKKAVKRINKRDKRIMNIYLEQN